MKQKIAAIALKYSSILILLLELILCHSEKFKKIDGISIDSRFSSLSFISSIMGLSKLGCITKCSFEGSCLVVTYFSNKSCILYNQSARSLLVDTEDGNSLLYVKQKCSIIGYKSNYSSGLINYLPFDYTVQDVIGGQDLSLKLKGEITTDRFNKPNSAILLENGYGEFPKGTYFASEGFTLMIWYKCLSYTHYQRIFDFGNGSPSDNILIHFLPETGQLRLYTAYGTIAYYCDSTTGLSLDTWTHVAVTFTQNTFVLYVNGIQQCTVNNQLKDVVRNFNYLGSTYWPNHPYIHAALDEMKIFDRTLTVSEIAAEKDKVDEAVYGQFLHVLQAIKVFSEGLVHYWPFAGSTIDIIGGKHLIIKEKGELIDDFSKNKESALVLNGGYGQFPPGTYFSTEGFTFMLWFKYLAYNYESPIIDFGNGPSSDTIMIYFIQETDKLFLHTSHGSTTQTCTSNSIPLVEWAHLALTFSQNTFVLYVNGIQQCTVNNQLKDVVRNFNYLGKSNWAYMGHIHAAFDEIKIFDRTLTASEIAVEKYKTQPFDIMLF